MECKFKKKYERKTKIEGETQLFMSQIVNISHYHNGLVFSLKKKYLFLHEANNGRQKIEDFLHKFLVNMIENYTIN